ncbi:MAG: hypothetical protein HY706_21550 [Candidatus Hydrogenedentes bacterium]|nr:hypothetical protein [Candidatus Hydrogenedentota bacterium]
MKATLLDLRRKTRRIVEAIERNETVTLTKHRREIALIVPKKDAKLSASLRESPAFGIWKNRSDMRDPAKHVRRLRQGGSGGL